jgi:hypothetical protein
MDEEAGHRGNQPVTVAGYPSLKHEPLHRAQNEGPAQREDQASRDIDRLPLEESGRCDEQNRDNPGGKLVDNHPEDPEPQR